MQMLESSEASTGLDIQEGLLTWLEVVVARSSIRVDTETGASIYGLSI